MYVVLPLLPDEPFFIEVPCRLLGLLRDLVAMNDDGCDPEVAALPRVALPLGIEPLLLVFAKDLGSLGLSSSSGGLSRRVMFLK
jgi:hypothetical protein